MWDKTVEEHQIGWYKLWFGNEYIAIFLFKELKRTFQEREIDLPIVWNDWTATVINFTISFGQQQLF